jgi:hypothetical protein
LGHSYPIVSLEVGLCPMPWRYHGEYPRRLSLVVGIIFVCAGILACQIPGIARKKSVVEGVAHDLSLVAVWREAQRIGEGGQSSEPSAPLLIGFFDDGTFKAVFGRYEVRENELFLHGIVLVDDFAGPTMVFSYKRPAPDGKVI